ncbi:SNAPous protein SNAP33 [Ananas comosus]|uniref:SNAPous protein SNAP33 n=1 Tax=Ananas comosus TaxID=4615 RepID=A0A199VSH0_ANACO|nr:SNAPous protein SNAP33 [Ananas comosus]
MSKTRTSNNKIPKQRSADTTSFATNPFDSDSELDRSYTKSARASSVPSVNVDEGRSTSTSSSGFSSARSKYKNDFRDDGGIENQSVQELESYAAYKAEETTERVNGCLRIAEEMREGASRTLVTLHQQGQQITRTHMDAVDIDHHLTRSEKLLGSLGGIFSKKWKPKKNREIKGPFLSRDDSFIRKGSHLEQRQRLGLTDPLPRSNPRRSATEPASALEKVEIEKAKQDDALSDLSNVLVELKGMAIDMGSEIERQTAALGNMEPEIDELNFRVRGANVRARRLLGK